MIKFGDTAPNMNSEESRAHWNLKFERGLTSLRQPDPFFISAYQRFADPLFSNAGAALDLACGLGRHALWLASRSWHVSATDVSDVAIEKVRLAAVELNVKLDLCAVDASDYEFGPMRFDLIVLFYHVDRSLFPKIIASLNGGGLLIFKARLQRESIPGTSPVRTDPLDKDELPSLVPDLQVMYHKERLVQGRGVVEFVGRKSGGLGGLSTSWQSIKLGTKRHAR
jgi:tellurite methyltransferase